MEENVALDRASQSSFRKAVKNVKKLIKKGTIKVADTAVEHGAKRNSSEYYKKAGESSGVVYLSHVPHGFYENQMRAYFSQFGHVTDVTLVRSQRTGNSKGYAFVEFLHAPVAKVVAETMNNYLMSNRLMKASYVETPKERKTKNSLPITPETCKTALNRAKNVWRKNRPLSRLQDRKAIIKENNKLLAIKQKLKEVNGIDLDFKIEHNLLTEKVGEVAAGPESDLESDCGAPVLELDESDFEVSFNPPPGMIVRRVSRSMNPKTKKIEAPHQQNSKKLTTVYSPCTISNKKRSSGNNFKKTKKQN